MKHKRKCPNCNEEIYYSRPCNFYRARQANKLCKSCCQIGKTFSDETKDKMRKRKLGIKHSVVHVLNNSNAKKKSYLDPLMKKKTSETTKKTLRRPDVRKRHIESMIKVHFLGNSMDIGCNELLNKWNKLGFHFKPNYQVHTDDFLCYIDRYDKDHNVVLEYDGKYHQKPSQKERDLTRQKKIIDILQPKKFWRYNSVNKQWVDVIGESI